MNNVSWDVMLLFFLWGRFFHGEQFPFGEALEGAEGYSKPITSVAPVPWNYDVTSDRAWAGEDDESTLISDWW